MSLEGRDSRLPFIIIRPKLDEALLTGIPLAVVVVGVVEAMLLMVPMVGPDGILTGRNIHSIEANGLHPVLYHVGGKELLDVCSIIVSILAEVPYPPWGESNQKQLSANAMLDLAEVLYPHGVKGIGNS